MNVPQANPKAAYLSHQAEIDAAIHRVLQSGWYILGREVEAFEERFSRACGVSYGVGVGSGTEALHLALRAVGVGRGDEVVTVSHTAVATVSAIEMAGGHPVLTDIDPESYTLAPDSLGAALTPRTRAVIVVHLYGQAADMDPILRIARPRGIAVIEDCAQAHGATYRGRPVGIWGDLGCFSFYPTKNLGAIGDGGMVVTDDRALAERCRLLRQYGWQERYVSNVPGWNSRLDELQAAILSAKLPHLEGENALRRRWAALYDELLRGGPVETPSERPYGRHVYHLYVVRSPHRDALRRYLSERGVGTAIHYAVPIHRQPAYDYLGLPAGSLPETERVASEILSLPMYPELTEEQVRYVAESVSAFHSPAGDES